MTSLYGHIPIQDKKYIFPITGFKLENYILKVGKVKFVKMEYLKKNVISNQLVNWFQTVGVLQNVETFAIIDLNEYGDISGLCKDGNNSLALQILKQTIGSIYLSIYNLNEREDRERRIVISDLGMHEIEEGLAPYLIHDGYGYKLYTRTIPYNPTKNLTVLESEIDLTNIDSLINLIGKNLKDRNEYESKICKSFEIIYSIFNEIYSRDRVLKLIILLNYIFREDNENIDSNDIGKLLKVIFYIIEKKNILENISEDLALEESKTKKITKKFVDVHSRVRNDVMHGKIELYTEYNLCDIRDLILIKVIVLELMNFMVLRECLENCSNTKEFKNYIMKKHKEDIDKHKTKK